MRFLGTVAAQQPQSASDDFLESVLEHLLHLTRAKVIKRTQDQEQHATKLYQSSYVHRMLALPYGKVSCRSCHFLGKTLRWPPV